jgi:hypothetical protein
MGGTKAKKKKMGGTKAKKKKMGGAGIKKRKKIQPNFFLFFGIGGGPWPPPVPSQIRLCMHDL